MPRSKGYWAHSISMKGAMPRTQGPEPSAARLAPWALSTGVVVSLGEGFVLRIINSTRDTTLTGNQP